MDANQFGRAKIILAVGVVLFGIGQSLLFVIVAPLAREVGLTALSLGGAFTLGNLAMVWGATFWGKKSDQVGRKPIFVWGLAGAALGTGIMAVSLEVGLAGLATGWMMFALLAFARAVYGGLASSIYPVATAYIADVTAPKDRAKGMAVIGAANGVGSVLGPALGGTLAAAFGVLFPLYFGVAICLVGCAWAAVMLREPAKHAAPPGATSLGFLDSRITPYLVLWACFFLIFISLQFVTAFYIQDRFGVTDPASIVRVASIALATMSVVIVVMQAFVFQIFRISARFALRMCPPCFALGALVMALAPSIPALIASYAVVGFAFAFAGPGINGSASLSVPPHEQGALAGFLAAASTGGALFAPIFGTAVYQLVAPSAPMWLAVAVFSALSVYTLTIKVPVPVVTPG